MKKLLILLALSMSITAFGRSWYVKPTIGIGTTGINRDFAVNSENDLFLKGEIATGLKISKIRLETGVGFINPGYKLTGLVFEGDIDHQTGQIIAHTDLDYNFSYLYLPIRAGYQIDVFAGLSVIPTIGIAAMYNVHAERVISTTRATPVFLNPKIAVNKFSALADAMVFAEYRIGSISVTAGASYKKMLSPVFDNGNERFHLLSGDAGILYHF